MSSDWQQRELVDLDPSIETVHRTSSHYGRRCVHLDKNCIRLETARKKIETERAVLWDDEPVCEYCDPKSPKSARAKNE